MVLYSMLLSALSQGLLYAPMALGVYITFRILRTTESARHPTPIISPVF